MPGDQGSKPLLTILVEICSILALLRCLRRHPLWIGRVLLALHSYAPINLSKSAPLTLGLVAEEQGVLDPRRPDYLESVVVAT